MIKDTIERTDPAESLDRIDELNRRSLDRIGNSIGYQLNKLISSGAYFSVSEDSFNTVGRPLTNSEMKYLIENREMILCFLQQSLLTKRLFAERNDLLIEFSYSIHEREAILIENGINEHEAYLKAVKMQTASWFAKLLDE